MKITGQIRRTILVLFTILISFNLLSADPAFSDEQSDQLINSFSLFCMTDIYPNFERLNDFAKAANLPILNDISRQIAPRQSARQKSWLMGTTQGPLSLIATEMINHERHVFSCAVVSLTAHGRDVRKSLVNELKLGSPVRNDEAGGSFGKTTVWKSDDGDTTIILDHADPDKPGANLIKQRVTIDKENAPGK